VSNLQVIINRKSRVARFSGGGTFQAKELIKELGRARFVGASKLWEVSQFVASSEELNTLFPGIIILEDEIEALGDQPSGTPTPSDGALVPNGISVSQFLGRVRAILRSAFPGTVCIYGVLSEVDCSSSGRVFLELKENAETDERVRCVIWQDADKICEGLRKAGFELERDLQIMLEVNVQLSKKGAYLSLSVERIVLEYTLAKLAALRDQTNERLKKEGLFAKNKEKRLPFLPRRLGILTSSGGTVINDFMASLDVAQFGFELFWHNVLVQGGDAKRSILAGIAALSARKDLDAILMFRGGGGQAELAVFNDYEIAKAVCLCPHPVISAIGHEEDQSSVQDVSFRALGVPKDIGRFFADIVLEFRSKFQTFAELIVSLGTYKWENSSEKVRNTSRTIAQFLHQSLMHLDLEIEKNERHLPLMARTLIETRARQFADLASPLSFFGLRVLEVVLSRFRALRREIHDRASYLLSRKQAEFIGLGHLAREILMLLENKATRISAYEELLLAASPEVQLKRGFALVRSIDKRLLTSGAALTPEQRVIIEFSDCERDAKIVAKE